LDLKASQKDLPEQFVPLVQKQWGGESNNDDSKNKDITWFHKIAALKLAKEFNEALFKLTAERTICDAR
jgi:hypothetical protein